MLNEKITATNTVVVEDASKLSNGIYFLQIQMDAAIETKKIVVKH